ncbi:MAG: hypothetical protein P8X74_00765 [Reinekea sp.]
MITTKDRHQLQRHLKQATQLYKTREKLWQTGAKINQLQSLELRLFASLSILSNYASDFLLTDWPRRPAEEKIALLAVLQSNDEEVISFAIETYQAILKANDYSDEYLSLLVLAQPINVTRQYVDRLLDAGIFNSKSEHILNACQWSPDTIRYLVIQAQIKLPFWLDETDELKHSVTGSIRRRLMQRDPSSEHQLTGYLQQQDSECQQWQWLPLVQNTTALNLFFEHSEQIPQHLWAAVFNGTSDVLANLEGSLEKSSLADIAAWSLEQLLNEPVQWQPAVAEAVTGKTLANVAMIPRLAKALPELNQPILLGQPKTPLLFTHWLLAQPRQYQSAGWIHLAQLSEQLMPDLSMQWLHTQLVYLSTIFPAPENSHAA